MSNLIQPVNASMSVYLEATHYIDWQHPEVFSQARTLALGLTTPEAIANKCFEFVRDQIKHSRDYALNPVTCKASDVLRHRTGYCYAKSHLLAALLRANHIPAGLCYQRLTLDSDRPPYCLHGLNAVFLEPYGWYRVDARGNKPGIHAGFCPPEEQLAFPITHDGEADLPGIWAEPLPVIVHLLETSATYQAVAENLPDIESLEAVTLK